MPCSTVDGSPPRMRGKRSDNWYRGRCSRITPADAGKTSVAIGTGVCNRDHPRGCGENERQKAIAENLSGSPPRMRGKLPYPTCFFVRVGITPADAGKTHNYLFGRQLVRDHPRGCGENTGDFAFISAEKGSPPRMRGKPAR